MGVPQSRHTSLLMTHFMINTFYTTIPQGAVYTPRGQRMGEGVIKKTIILDKRNLVKVSTKERGTKYPKFCPLGLHTAQILTGKKKG